MNFQKIWTCFSKPIEIEGKNDDLQRFQMIRIQILQNFKIQKILESYSFLPNEFPEKRKKEKKMVFKIATAYASLS